jgi:hypothetical protein
VLFWVAAMGGWWWACLLTNIAYLLTTEPMIIYNYLNENSNIREREGGRERERERERERRKERERGGRTTTLRPFVMRHTKRS